MTNNPQHHKAYQQALQKQAAATSPHSSVFVSANAGTGKTHVLTNRVLRLLLSGAAPDSILCVTYTKAAAAEMRHRLSERLQKWAICAQEVLIADIKDMGEPSPTQSQMDKARELFAYILDFGDSPQIDTLHAFCQRILRRFPLEAEVPPFFELSDEETTARYLHTSLMEVVDTAYRQSTDLRDHIQFLISKGLDEQLFDHLRRILSDRKTITQLSAAPLGVREFSKRLETECGFTPPEKLDEVLTKWVLELSAENSHLRQFAVQLSDGGKRLSDRALKIQDWLSLESNAEKIAKIERLYQGVFNADGARPKSYSDKKIKGKWGDISALAEQVAGDVELVREIQQSAESYRVSVALCDLAIHVFRQFQRAKRESGLLDFDDLIYCTEQLLSKSEIMAWVRFKLDQGVDHILLDEAQDTSPSQWALIDKLTDSFFDGSEQDREQERSLFVVGDYKQSIYSFQGAKPGIFTHNKQAYQQKAEQAQKPFQALQFGMSFRSSAAVLQFVDALMTAQSEEVGRPLSGLGDEHTAHESFKYQMPGFVEIRKHTIAETEKNEPEPFALVDDSDVVQADLEHAQSIAQQVQALIQGSHNERLGRIVRPSDILILVKKRNRFYALLRAQLEALNVPFAGGDRIKLNNQIEILDLLALGDVCLLPQNDLQLACLLKSPLFGLDEDALFKLAYGRGAHSLFDQLRSHDGADTQLGQAASKLRHWLNLAEKKSVFEFYSEVLNTGGRQAFYQRLGSVIDDALNMFLQKARDACLKGSNDLHGFLADFRRSAGEIKREFDVRTRDEVRIMSIHGAKGLQAPIVFLPDTLRDKSIHESIYNSAVGPIWSSAATKYVGYVRTLKSEQEKTEQEEEDRLLYVALTRAEQALFISGWEKKQNRFYEGSWLALMDQVKDYIAQAQAHDPTTLRIDENCWQLSSGNADISALEEASEEKDGPSLDEAPQWFFETPPNEPLPARPLSPSDLVDGGYATSFVQADRNKALLFGQFAHKLLEILPNYQHEQRPQAALLIQHQLASHYKNEAAFLEAEGAHVIANMCKIIDDDKFAPLFQEDALVEASVSGLVGHLPVAGKIDRMIIQPDKVIILDFKTGKPAQAGSEVPINYAAQMAAYGALMAEIYPDKEIKCYLLWTQNQSITEITQHRRAEIITQLLANSSEQILNS